MVSKSAYVNVCLCDRLIVFLCQQTSFQTDLRSQVGLCIVLVLRLLWAIGLLISMNGQFSRQNHSLNSPGSYHNPMCQLIISVYCLISVQKNGCCTCKICFVRIFNLLIWSKVLIGCFIVTNILIELDF